MNTSKKQQHSSVSGPFSDLSNTCNTLQIDQDPTMCLTHKISDSQSIVVDTMEAEKAIEEAKESITTFTTHAKDAEKRKNAEKGKEEFSRIAEDENKRVQQVAEIENKRIMKQWRANETVHICPICLEEINAIISHEDRKRGTTYEQMLCCNTRHCHNCAAKSMEFMHSGHEKCYNCREPLHSIPYWANTIKPNDKRHWLMVDIGEDYVNGTNGLKKNIKKGLKFFERAAELGDADAQGGLADIYYNGNIVPESFEKAIYYAEKGADQGVLTSQCLLADMIMHSPDFNSVEGNEKVLKLLTLASYQGCHHSRGGLGSYYSRMADKFNKGEEGWKKNTLLSVYWFGKAGEAVQVKDPLGCEAMACMADCFNEAMDHIWYPREDATRGYSDVPFFTWVLAKGGQYTAEMEWSKPWKSQCANCNKVSQEDTQLKACARCKACHYCSKKCQVEHWKDGHKVDCKGHWIEEFFPDLRMVLNNI